jgi:hypothetical protein
MHVRRVVLAVIILAALVPGGVARAAIEPPGGQAALEDLDVRAAVREPGAVQRAAARALGGTVAWNRFGTPSSLVGSGGALGAPVGDATAEAAARAWLRENARLFRLGPGADLRLVRDSRLAGDAGHAVTLQQVVGGLGASGGGLVTIGLTGSSGAWTVASASSTLLGDDTLAGKASLSPEQALQRAAANAGVRRSLAQMQPLDAAKAGLRGWKVFQLAGVEDVQRARAVAFPTVARGYVPAYETIVLDADGAAPAAYRTFVDGQTGAVLLRASLVEHAVDPEVVAAAEDASFTGELPAEDGGCDTPRGPFTVAPGETVRAIDVFVDADTAAQDIVIRLLRGTTELEESDTFLTPERIRFEPAGGVPPGDYFVEVCEFEDDVPPVEPRTYHGTIDFDTSEPPEAHLARWRLFPSVPPLNELAADPWNNPSTDTREDWCWRRGAAPADCDRVVGNLAARMPWDHDPRTNAPSNSTVGNNARTAESWTHPLLPSPTQFRPVSAERDYAFPWTNAWNTADCNPGSPFGAAFQPGQSFDIAAAVTNLFTMHNRMHDWSYLLGFTEENWNAQETNFGLTESRREHDPIIGDAQAGAVIPPPDVYEDARNNANMITLPDGSPSVTNMYMWQPVAGTYYPPCVDGDYDAGVIGHEYTHMIENRMVGKGDSRSGHHAGAMGEASGDLLAMEQANETGTFPTDANRYTTGSYVTGNKVRGIRNYAPNFPETGAFPEPSLYAQVDPLNFSDIGYDTTSLNVHSDGEIWQAVNFDIRKALVARYDAQFPESDTALQQRCAVGDVPVDRCPGNRRWIQLVVDAFLLMPADASMVDARNAMLAADTMRFGGAHQADLWLAFARRGLGRFTSSSNGTGRERGVESDTDPLPDFEAPDTGNATVLFRATTLRLPRSNVRARIYVGHYEGRVSPIADTDPTTDVPTGATTNNLDRFATFAPGTYEFIATAPGRGAVRFRETFEAGEEPRVTIRFAANAASKVNGATASGDATAVTSPTSVPPNQEVLSQQQVLDRLIDDTEATAWQAAAREEAGRWSVAGRRVDIDLRGTAPFTIRRVQVSAMLGPVFDTRAADPTDLLQSRFTALRQFQLQACNAAVADCATDAGFTPVVTSAEDAFPGDAPRPVAPMLLLRNWTFPAIQATHLRFVVLNSQCTGGPVYQGEQDADPFNATDCDTAGPATTRFVRAAEVQAFGRISRAVVD